MKEDERPVGIPQLNEIKQIIDNDNTQGFTGLKLKISEIIDDEVNSLKVIQNLEYLRSKQKVNTL